MCKRDLRTCQKDSFRVVMFDMNRSSCVCVQKDLYLCKRNLCMYKRDLCAFKKDSFPEALCDVNRSSCVCAKEISICAKETLLCETETYIRAKKTIFQLQTLRVKDTAHAYKACKSFIRETWLICVRDMTRF